jgi:hypothetical protein
LARTSKGCRKAWATIRATGSSRASKSKTPQAEKPKKVVKQGLSEYFLFTIEGREDIKDKRAQAAGLDEVADVPARVSSTS